MLGAYVLGHRTLALEAPRHDDRVSVVDVTISSDAERSRRRAELIADALDAVLADLAAGRGPKFAVGKTSVRDSL